MDIEKLEIQIPCKSCGRKMKKSIGWIKRKNKFICDCGALFNAEQFKVEIAKVEAAATSIESTLKKFNK